MYLFSSNRRWNRFPEVDQTAFQLPAGDAVARWNLGDSLVDTVNGIAFVDAPTKGGDHGPSMWHKIPCYQVSNNSSSLGTVVAYSPLLRIAGDVTLEVILTPNVLQSWSYASTFQAFASYGGTSAGLAYNMQYALGCNYGGTRPAYLSESASGTDRLIHGGIRQQIKAPIYAAVTRSGTTVTLYDHGSAQYAATLAELPSGGDDASCGL